MAPRKSNSAPKCKWSATVLACGTKRQRLLLDGTETPFFIDSACGQRAHRSYGDEHGLWGAGMSEPTRAGYRIAACLGSGARIAPLKHRAEQMAFSQSTAA